MEEIEKRGITNINLGTLKHVLILESLQLVNSLPCYSATGLMISGIYHLSGSAEQITTLQQRIDQGQFCVLYM